MEDKTVVAPSLTMLGQVTGSSQAEATRAMNVPVPTAALDYGDRTQQAMTMPCPACGTPNGPAERFCQDCGFMFGSASVVEPLPDLANSPRLIDGGGREFPLNEGVNTVGRDAADILIVDPTVSRAHARVTLKDGVLTIEDLGSTNGSKVGDLRIGPNQPTQAGNGGTVRFGNITLNIVIPGGAAVTPAAPAPAAAPAAPVAAQAAVVEDRGEAVAEIAMGDGTAFPLYLGVNPVGRRSGNQIVISDAFMSGSHAEIHCEAGGAAVLIDTGSTNGTFVAGARLAANEPVSLSDAQEFTFGKTQFTFRALGGAAAEPPGEGGETSEEQAGTASQNPPAETLGDFVLDPEPAGESRP